MSNTTPRSKGLLTCSPPAGPVVADMAAIERVDLDLDLADATTNVRKQEDARRIQRSFETSYQVRGGPERGVERSRVCTYGTHVCRHVYPSSQL